MTKPYGYEDFMEVLAVIEDEGDDLSGSERFTRNIIATFDYLLVSESEGDPARIASVMREIGMTGSAAILDKLPARAAEVAALVDRVLDY